MKHRILQFGNDRFVLQEKTFLFWYDMSDKYRISKFFLSLAAAQACLCEYKRERELQRIRKQEEEFRSNNIKIHTIE